MSKIIKFNKPICPYCGEGEIIECSTAILADSGSEIMLEGRVKEVGIGEYKALERSGRYEAVYRDGESSVGIAVDYSKDPNSKLECDIQDTVYRCTHCDGLILGSPYTLANVLVKYDKD